MLFSNPLLGRMFTYIYNATNTFTSSSSPKRIRTIYRSRIIVFSDALPLKLCRIILASKYIV
ncbi:MAG: hypothetical protein QXY40_00975 [Candidatus Methanomethylicia archaeon]